MEDFDTVDDEQLVHLISNHPEIYNPKNQSYKLRTEKERIWQTISGSLNKSAAACKKRWKNIRDNYYKQKKNTKKPTGTAGPGNRKRNPILDQLGFLEVVEHERRVLTNGDTQLDPLTDTDNSQDQLDEVSTDESIEANDIPTDTPNVSTLHQPSKGSSNNDKGVPPKKRRKDLSSEIPSAIKKGSSEREAFFNQLTAVPTTTPPEDETDILFKSLAMTVKKFPPLLRVETKSKVFQLISDAELKLLRPRSTSSRLSSFSYASSSLLSPATWDQQDNPIVGTNNQPTGSDTAQ